MEHHRSKARRSAVFGAGLVLIVMLATFVPQAAAAQQAGPQAVYFAQTGHHLDNTYGFLDYWRANGQVLRFGYPVTEVIEEGGRPVQYFERARMEYHADNPANFKVLLGLLGRELTASQPFPIGPVAPGRVFSETGYTVFGKFLQYWNNWGGLYVFGYPISESYVETLSDGSTRAVQWFERGRLEYHPEAVDPFYRERRAANNSNTLTLYEIQMGQLGREVALQRSYNLSAVARRAGVPVWSPGLWQQRIVVDLSDQQLTAYEGNLQVFRAGVSTGADKFETVTGTFNINTKLLYDDMTGNLQGEEYDVRKVPYVMYFYRGYAIHGTYWHNDFGTGVRRSHGCVNLSLDKAQWLWEWTQPQWSQGRAVSNGQPSLEPNSEADAALQPLQGLAVYGRGTQVVVQE